MNWFLDAHSVKSPKNFLIDQYIFLLLFYNYYVHLLYMLLPKFVVRYNHKINKLYWFNSSLGIIVVLFPADNFIIKMKQTPSIIILQTQDLSYSNK